MKLRSMKPKPEKDVTCSFCKKKNTKKQIQGHPYGGRTCCTLCFETNDQIQNSIRLNNESMNSEPSLGEERIAWIYGI